MLTLYSVEGRRREVVTDPANAPLPPDIIWIELDNPTEAERAFVQRTTGIDVPVKEDLVEIEASSRLSVEDDVLYLSATALTGVQAGDPHTTPLGFVLTEKHLITTRFAALPSMAGFAEQITTGKKPPPCSAALFAGLLDAIVDRMADILERLGAELDMVSRRVFHARAASSDKVDRARPEEENLRETLGQIGKAGYLTAKIRECLLGFARIVPYVEAHGGAWIPDETKPHLASVRHDLASLNDYDAYLSNQVQFLLDATLGLINIQQNNIIKVLTVVSVVGVPPTFLASLYGMNFKNIPEYDWSWGYPYALCLMVVSAIGPYLWFKFRGWL
ncbi:MAG TPA: magnesium transporter CorA family protein [Aliidongia sp.]|nr:magnesium transporter CorA family protein [Aliidongia sp.]